MKYDSMTSAEISKDKNQLQPLTVEKQPNGKHLQTDVNKQLGGYVCDAALMLLQDKWEFIARNIHCEMKKKFADIATFIELLGAQNNYNMQKIKEIFYKMYRCELDDAAEKEVHGHFQKIIALLLKTDRDESFKVDHQKVEEDAKVLRAAGVGIKYASDAAVLFTFLNSRSYSHLKKMFEAYHRLTGKTIQEKIQNEYIDGTEQYFLLCPHVLTSRFPSQNEQLCDRSAMGL
ncbi:annexin A1-like [Schistocerca cancellata]|uniref:annexin A1-like n=1 Tax=Schistocerca cancellata TaxID=274614 RepID=UPI002118A6A3|nr:annexin A1-like [Schistocerca cancellata]